MDEIYSSGLNENLQRSFLKNAVQYFDIMNARYRRRQNLSLIEKDKTISQENKAEAKSKLNKYYLSRFKGVFFSRPATWEDAGTWEDASTWEDAGTWDDYQYIDERDTKIPSSIFLEYDSVSLLMACMVMLPKEELDKLLPDIEYRYPSKFTLTYDFLKFPFADDSVADVKQLIEVAGAGNVEGHSRQTTDEEYDLYELDYLCASITIDLDTEEARTRLYETFLNSPLTLFEKLYKIQLLGVKNWQTRDKKKLRQTSFMDNVKKPMKTHLPLEVTTLKMSKGSGLPVDFDDLSDGEAQFIQIMAACRIFSEESTLFVFDEPETHFNPTWKTSAHHSMMNAIKDTESQGSQVLLSTHSPFLLSAIGKENVRMFEKTEQGVRAEKVSLQTYGASFEVLIKQFFGLKSLISETALNVIKEKLKKESNEDMRKWIEENLGDSMEKAYLLRKLKQ